MKDKHDTLHFVWRQLQCSDVVGDILQFALFVESSVDGVLVDYFVPGARREAFEGLLLQRLSFYQKLEIFSSLPLKRPLESHRALCSVFASTRRLRNYVAHKNYSYDEPSVRKLANDPNVIRWLEGVPHSFEHEYRSVRRQLGALSRAKIWSSTWEDDPRDVPF